MTREKASSILKSILADLQRGAKDTDNISCCLEYGFITYGKAKDCIKALEQEPCEDAISRQEVLDLIADYDLSMGQVVRGIHALPSVTPQPRWIPVSERLPEDYETVIASVDDGFVYPEARYSKEDGWEWAYESGADYWTEIKCDVVAWMPLPEPYKAETEG